MHLAVQYVSWVFTPHFIIVHQPIATADGAFADSSTSFLRRSGDDVSGGSTAALSSEASSKETRAVPVVLSAVWGDMWNQWSLTMFN